MHNHKPSYTLNKKYEVYNPIFPDIENKNAVLVATNLTYEEALIYKKDHPEFTIYPQYVI